MPTSTPWQDLVANALIGTDRQPPQRPSLEGPLQVLLSQLPAEPEPMLLQSAGILASYQQAGQCAAVQAGPLPSPCLAETLCRCSERTHQHLQTILSGQYKDTLLELLDLIAQADQHVPAEILPTLLEQGRRQTQVRPSLQAVMGERGRWLAQHNPVWAYAAGQPFPRTKTGEIDQEAVENLWKTSDYPVRLNLLKTFRSLKPYAAREMLATTWKQEKAKDRATFLALLQSHISLADEPFLEVALGDRAQDVRAGAGSLLAFLPDSQYCQRMAEQVQTYVQFTDNTVILHLPKEDDTWKSEGLAPIPGKLGKRASLLSQIVAAVPLEKWLGEPTALISRVESHQHSVALMTGWTLAAQRQGNRGWAKALIEAWLRPSNSDGLQAACGLFALLLAQDLEIQLEAWLNGLQSDAGIGIETLHALVCEGPPPSFQFSQRIWGLVKANLYPQLSQSKHAYQMRLQLQSLAHYLHPDIIHGVEADLNTLDMDQLSTYHQDSLSRFRETLQFRQTIRLEFKL